MAKKKVIYKVIEVGEKSERYYSKESLKKLLKGKDWIVQLVRLKEDKRSQKQQSVFYKGSSVEKVIEKITPNWGQWLLTQAQKKKEESVFTIFGLKEKPIKYKVRAIEMQ